MTLPVNVMPRFQVVQVKPTARADLFCASVFTAAGSVCLTFEPMSPSLSALYDLTSPAESVLSISLYTVLHI